MTNMKVMTDDALETSHGNHHNKKKKTIQSKNSHCKNIQIRRVRTTFFPLAPVPPPPTNNLVASFYEEAQKPVRLP